MAPEVILLGLGVSNMEQIMMKDVGSKVVGDSCVMLMEGKSRILNCASWDFYVCISMVVANYIEFFGYGILNYVWWVFCVHLHGSYQLCRFFFLRIFYGILNCASRVFICASPW
nr:hypothetical protein Iba_chr15aCG8440 [Ipomoea batatas]